MSTSPDLSNVRWITSSYSNGGGGECVEWAPDVAATTGIVPVRDSKDPEGPALLFPRRSWSAFITALRTPQFPTP